MTALIKLYFSIMLILGTHCNPDKAICESIQSIYGLNSYNAFKMCALSGINPYLKLRDLKPGRLERLNRYLRDQLSTVLKRQTKDQIKQLINIKNVRGVKLMFGLPARGQRTRTNASTAKKLSVMKTLKQQTFQSKKRNKTLKSN